jgi:hypothetical protein
MSTQIDFETTNLPDTTDMFYQFEQYPQTAAMLFHMNSGGNLFSDLDWLGEEGHSDEEVDKAIWKLMDEVDGMLLSDSEKDLLMQKFFIAQGRGGYFHGKFKQGKHSLPPSQDAHIVTCACCGLKDSYRTNNFYELPLKDLLEDFTLTEEQAQFRQALKDLGPICIPVDEKDGTSNVHLHNLQSVYHSKQHDTDLNLHPEFIYNNNKKDECCLFCMECSWEWKKNKSNKTCPINVPLKSVANGVDFGDYKRIGLTEPNTMEISAIAKIRHYHSIFKISDNKEGGRTDCTNYRLRGHHILFKHDAPFRAALRFLNNMGGQGDNMSLKDILSRSIVIQLIGSKGKYDPLCQRLENNGYMHLRPHVIYQWLKVLKFTHPLYEDDPDLPHWLDFKREVQETEKEIIDSAQHVHEQELVDQDVILGDDIAEVRTASTVQTSTEEADNSNLCTSSSYLLDSASYNPLKEERKEQLETLAEVLNIDIAEDIEEWDKNHSEPQFKSYREDEPVSSFDDLDELLTGAFPHVFMFGRAYNNRSLYTSDFRHLLLQYTTIAAKDRQLLFFLFDYHILSSFTGNFNTRINNNRAAFETFAAYITSERFREMVAEALKDKDSPLAEEIYDKIYPALAMGCKNQPLGSLLDNSCLSRALAMCHRFGPASVFLTVTPDDISNPTSFRLCFRSCANCGFPSTTKPNFLTDMQQSAEYIDEVNVKLPTTYTDRHFAACSNPVAVASEFQSLVENVLTILIGCPSKKLHTHLKDTRRQWYFMDHSKDSPHHTGIFGDISAFFGTIETQQRGALHFHVLLWGGLIPRLMEKAIDFNILEKKLARALDNMYSASAPIEQHVLNQIRLAQNKHDRKNDLNIPRALLIPPKPTWKQKFASFFHKTLLHRGFHIHSWSCKKGKAGQFRCRHAMPAGSNEFTRLIQLELEGDIKGLHSVLQVEPKSPPKELYLKVDGRVIVWELMRPLLSKLPEPPIALSEITNTAYTPTGNDNRAPYDSKAVRLHTFLSWQILTAINRDETNQYIPEIKNWLDSLQVDTLYTVYTKMNETLHLSNCYLTQTNDVLAASTGGSTNALFLGSSQQSRAALYYVTKYVTKTKVARGNCLLALAASLDAVAKYPSKAKDTGTDKRTAQHVLTKVHNILFRHAEISDTQAALTLLGTRSEIASTNFAYFAAKHMVAGIKAELKKNTAPATEKKRSQHMHTNESKAQKTKNLRQSCCCR